MRNILLFAVLSFAAPAWAVTPHIGYWFDYTQVWAFNWDSETNVAKLPLPVTNDFVSIYSIAVNPNGKFVYAVVDDENPAIPTSTLFVTDTATNKIVERLPLYTSYFVGFEEVAVSPDGKTIWVLEESPLTGGYASIEVYCAITYAHLASITTTADGRGVSGAITFSPDGRRAYVTGASFVNVISTVTKTVVGSLALPEQPLQAAIAPDGTRLYVLTPNYLQAISTDSLAVVHEIHPERWDGFYGLAVSPDGKCLWAGGERLIVVDAATDDLVGTFPEYFSGDLTFRPDGRNIYDYRYILSPANGQVVATTNLFGSQGYAFLPLHPVP